MSVTTLYLMPQVVTLFTPGASSVSTPTNRIDFKLFKNVSNRIDFLVKTIDKRPAIDVTTLTIIISDIKKKKVILTSSLVEIDKMKGHYRLNLLPHQTASMENTSYRYNVIYSDLGENLVLYSDEFRGVVGYLHVDDGVVGSGGSSTEIDLEAFTCDDILGIVTCSSSFFPGAAQVNNTNGHQTLAVYSDAYTGTVKVMASLDNSPNEDGWFEVGCRKLTRYTGVSGIRFTGNHMWLKVQYIDSASNTGKLTKLVLRVD